MNKLKLLTLNHWLLIIIIIIAAFFRLYNITELPPGLYPDEAMNGNNALEALSDNGKFKIFYPENNGREGLFINIQAMSIAVFGNEPWALRIVSALFGILTVLGVYFLTKELFGKKSFENWKLKIENYKVALLSAFLMATSFWHINFSRIGFRAIMAPFFLTWGIYFLLKAFRQIKEQKSPIFYILSSIFSGILYGFGFHSYIAYRATPLLILIIIALYWFQNKEKEIRKKILLVASGYILMAIIVTAPLGIYFIQNPQDFFGRTTQVSVFNSPTPLKNLSENILKTAGMFNFSGDWNWRHNYAGKPLLFWPVGILFLIGITASIRRLFSENFFAPVFLFSWLIIAALPVIISNEGLPHSLRAIIMIPPIFILTGFGGVWLIEKIKNQISNIKITIKNSKFLNFTLSFYILIFTFFIWLTFNAYNSYFIDWGKNPNVQGAFAADYVKMGRELNALPNPPTGGLPKYVIVEANGVNVRDIPMPTQTIMFITDTFTPEKQKEKNIYYILPKNADKIPINAYTIILK